MRVYVRVCLCVLLHFSFHLSAPPFLLLIVVHVLNLANEPKRSFFRGKCTGKVFSISLTIFKWLPPQESFSVCVCCACECVCMCVCAVCVHAYVWAHKNVCACVRLCVCVNVWVQVRLLVYVRVFACVRVWACVRSNGFDTALAHRPIIFSTSASYPFIFCEKQTTNHYLPDVTRFGYH